MKSRSCNNIIPVPVHKLQRGKEREGILYVQINNLLLRASSLTLEINEFRCYEVKIEGSERHIEDCEGWWLSCCCERKVKYIMGIVVVWLSWLSGRALLAQARGVLGLTLSDRWLFHFPLFSPHNI